MNQTNQTDQTNQTSSQINTKNVEINLNNQSNNKEKEKDEVFHKKEANCCNKIIKTIELLSRNIQKETKENPKEAKIIKNIIIAVLVLFSLVFYTMSLSGCNLSEIECLKLRPPTFYIYLLKLCVVAAIFLTAAIYLIFIRFGSYLHLIYIILIYSFLFYKYNGGDLADHGKYNTICMFICVSLFVIFILLLKVSIKLIKKNEISRLIMYILIIAIFFWTLHRALKLSSKCDNWDRGLNNTKIRDDEKLYKCQIDRPKLCHIKIFSDVFDFSKILRVDCSKRSSNDINKIRKNKSTLNININTKRIGFPITINPKINEFNLKHQLNYYIFLVNVLYNLVDMDNEEQVNQLPENLKPEVILDYTDNKYGDIKINLIKHEKLSEERKLLEKNSNPLYKNIFVVFMDAVSRSQFLRKMKKTAAYLEKFFKYDNNLGYHAFQFLKYNNFASSTIPNILPMFYGTNHNNRNGTQLIKYLKENGFITGQTTDLCSKELGEFYMNNQHEEKDNFTFVDFDHENLAMFCDPNYYTSLSSHGLLLNGPYSLIRRCLYGKDIFEYQLEYAKQFWKAYPDNRKFFRLAINVGHESSFEVLKYFDGPFLKFLAEFYENGYFKDTAFFILSDHGNQMPFIYNIIGSEDYDLERTLGTLFIVLPDKDNNINDFYKNIINNQQIFITPYDIHDTLIHICYGTEKYDLTGKITNFPWAENEGNSLLSFIDPSKRTCDNYNDWDVNNNLCRCH